MHIYTYTSVYILMPTKFNTKFVIIQLTVYLFPNLLSDAWLYTVNVGAQNIIYLINGLFFPLSLLCFNDGP